MDAAAEKLKQERVAAYQAKLATSAFDLFILPSVNAQNFFRISHCFLGYTIIEFIIAFVYKTIREYVIKLSRLVDEVNMTLFYVLFMAPRINEIVTYILQK